jgi:hypothetical protein
MFDLPKSNQFTQGTIFSCAHAENYGEKSAHGLIITARCDAAQDKAPIYNFIPVVSLDDWLLRDGAEIILQRALLDAFNGKKNIIVQAGFSESLLRTKTSSEILEGVLQPRVDVDKKFEPKMRQFMAFDGEIEKIEKSLSTWDDDLIKDRLKNSSKHLDSVIKELSGNRLLGYYLLRQMPTLYGDNGGNFVALLREIHHIPNAIAKKIVSGIEKNAWGGVGTIGLKCPKFNDADDYCAPIARLKSPWMEHLMQSLTMLFARIGVEDVDATSVRKSVKFMESGLA